MFQLPDDLSYEEWLSHVFDHEPATNYVQHWYWADDAEWWDETRNADRVTAYLIRMMSDPVKELAEYNNAQIEQGMNYLISGSLSEAFSAALGLADPVEKRLQVVAAIYIFFEQIYAQRCTPHLSHQSETGDPLNMSCYMWWDILPVFHKLLDDVVVDACITTMEKTLALPSMACQESALHGLGHWYEAAPERICAIIDAYLKRNPDLLTELRNYALSARGGCVQ